MMATKNKGSWIPEDELPTPLELLKMFEAHFAINYDVSRKFSGAAAVQIVGEYIPLMRDVIGKAEREWLAKIDREISEYRDSIERWQPVRPEVRMARERLRGEMKMAGNEIEGEREKVVETPETLTLEHIERDKWEAVKKPLPHDADRELILEAMKATKDCVEEASVQMAEAINPDSRRHFNEKLIYATDRADELKTRFDEIGFGPVRPEMREPGMYAELKEVQSEEELPENELTDTRRDDLEAHLGMRLEEFLAEQDEAYRQRQAHIEQSPASEIMAFLADRVEEAAQGIEKGLDVLGNAGEKAARVVDLVLNVATGYFVEDPRMTSQQVHDAKQASAAYGNLEAQDGQAFVAHVADRNAFHEWLIHENKSEDQETNLRVGEALGTNATAEASTGIEVTAKIERGRHM